MRRKCEPIVFDFEDGLQGWELSGSAQRVQTQVLGGEWAIFGEGASLSIEIDLTGIASISVEQFWAGEPSLFPFETHFLTIAVIGSSGGRVGALTPVPRTSGANPDTRAIGVSRFEGVHSIKFLWHNWFRVGMCIPDPCPPRPSDHLLGFIDNITFHPVPEPSSMLLAPESSSWLLLSLGIAGVVTIRRKLASRA